MPGGTGGVRKAAAGSGGSGGESGQECLVVSLSGKSAVILM